MRELRLSRDLSTAGPGSESRALGPAPSRDTGSGAGVLATLRAEAPGVLHVVDPYKVPVARAAAIATALADLGHRVMLIGSTDNPAFDAHVAPYVARLREHTNLRLILHFPPIPRRGAPLCPGADGVLLHIVLNSTHRYFVSQSEPDTRRELAHWSHGPAPEPIRSASFAFGDDAKTHQAVGSVPTAEGGAALTPFLEAVVADDFDAAYLLSRGGHTDPAVYRLFRSRMAPHQLLFAGGGVRSRRQVEEYIDSGVDWVVVGNALEAENWRLTLHEIIGSRERRDHRPCDHHLDDDLVRELRRGLRHPLGTSPQSRQAYAANVGGLSWKLPALVARVRTADEVAHVLRTARAAGVEVAVRGTGHSFGPQGLSDGGLLMVNELGEPDLVTNPDGTAEFSTRTAWHSVEAELNRRGRAMPVLTNHLTVSVGGTLSVGGYGEGTVEHGGQIDLVERFRLILPDGRAIWCSAEKNTRVFRYGLGSLGQLGVLDRVVTRTVPYHRTATIAVSRVPSLANLVDEAAWLAEAEPTPVDYFSGQHYEGGFLATYGVRGDRPLPAYLRGRAATRTETDWSLRSLGETRRNPVDPSIHFLWTDYALELAEAGRFARFLERRILADPAYERYRGRVLMLAANGPERRPGLPFAPTTGLRGLVLGFGLYFGIPKGDADGVARVRALHQRTMRACLDGGGRPYLAGWYELTEADTRALYGEDLTTLRRLRRELDPSGLLNPGLLA